MSDMATTISETYGLPIRRFSVDDYHRMGEAGIFDDDERVELLDGLVITMSPIGNRHAQAVRKLDKILQAKLGDRAIVDAANPLRLGRYSEPEPDVKVLRQPLAAYEDRPPSPADALLVIEVSESSLKKDRGPKLRSYAESGVRELWIVDLVHEHVEVHEEPVGERYRRSRVLRRGETIAPAAFPEDAIAVADILPAQKGS